jgi:hypothetical protein
MTKLTEMTGEQLQAEWHSIVTGWNERYAIAALRDRIVAECAANLAEAERDIARKAWDAATRWMGVSTVASWPGRDAYLDREYPAPAPEGMTLSDGSVVTRHGALLRVLDRDDHDARGTEYSTTKWKSILTNNHTGADFDALKAFAQKVGAA